MDNLKAAARSLLTTPGPTIVVVVTLALAIGANTAIFSVVDSVLLRPLYGDDGRLVVVWATSGSEGDIFRLSPADYRDLRDGAEGFDGQVALYRSIGSTLTGLERPVSVGSFTVTPGLFGVLGTQPAVGQLFVAADEVPGGPRKVVITHASWTRRFGADPSLLGTSIEVDGQARTVVGITEPGFQFPPGDDEVEIYFPMAISDGILLDRDHHRMFDSIARLADGTTLETVRAALGAGRADLCRRSLAETLVLGTVGGAAGLLLAAWGMSLLRAVMPGAIPRGEAISMNGAALLFAAGLSIGATMLFGLLPALRSMAPDLNELLKPTGASGGATVAGRRLRELMVVVEVALAIILLVGAGLMVRSFARLSEVDPGFRKEGVVSVAVKVPTQSYGRTEWRPFFERLVDRVGQLPGVNAVGASSDLPLSDVGLGFEMEFTVVGLDALSPTARPNADFRLVLPGYFEAMGMEIVRGRAFDRLDPTSDRFVAIVNQTVVDRYFRDIDPIGRSVRVQSVGEVEVVGVVADIRHGGLQSKYESELFVPYGRIATYEMHVVVQSDLNTGAVAAAVGDVLADIDPQLTPSRVASISDLLWESVAQPRFNTALLASLALCAAILAVIGTYGIVAYSVSQRTTEIGVRMALGADSMATVTMIVRQALVVVLVGAVLGVLGALGATRFLGQLLFDVQPTDPLTYGVVIVAAVVVGALAAWLPARRATHIDPVAALRDE